MLEGVLPRGFSDNREENSLCKMGFTMKRDETVIERRGAILYCSDALLGALNPAASMDPAFCTCLLSKWQTSSASKVFPLKVTESQQLLL